MHLKNKLKQVDHQEIALDNYLSTLLDKIPDNDFLDITEDHSISKTLESEIAAKHVRSVAVKSKKNIIRSGQADPKTTKTVNPLSVMPYWTQHEFQALFFKVDKLIMAAPLIELLRAIKIETTPTKIPEQPSWFLGLLDEKDHRIGVLDTGQLIFGKTIGQQRDLEKQPFKSILITLDGKWGLACDEILSIGKLKPDKVRWRTLRRKRPWLIGTVIEELTAVIDVNQLVPRRRNG